MQNSEQLNFTQNPSSPPLTSQGGHNDSPFSSVFGEMPLNIKHLLPFQNVNFQPSETCPRNFVIFDRTDNRSQIMYNPGPAQKPWYPTGLNIGSSPWLVQDNLKANEVLFSKKHEISPSIIKEDSADIEALLSFEEEEYDDEEVVSTGRSCNYGSDSGEDLCSSKRRKKSEIVTSSNGSGKSRMCGERKREKMRKMVKALRAIVPGSNNRRMKSVDVLDEAVRYLKSLKVDVQKVGVGNSKN